LPENKPPVKLVLKCMISEVNRESDRKKLRRWVVKIFEPNCKDIETRRRFALSEAERRLVGQGLLIEFDPVS